MTERRPDGPYEIPLERIGRGRGDGRRAGLVAVVLVAIVGGAIGLARLSDQSASASPSPTAKPIVAAGSIPAAASPSAPIASRKPRVEKLLDIANVHLAGAPVLQLVKRNGLDLQLMTWTPGGDLETSRTVRAALTAADPVAFPVVAPSGDLILLVSPSEAVATGAGDTGRLVDASGAAIWTAKDLVAASGGAWSTDSRLLVTVGQARHWHLVTIGANGKATDRVVRLPSEVFLPTPTPIGSLSNPGDEPRTLPLGFSADGRWIYGGVVSPQLGILIGEFRINRRDGHVQPVLDLRVGSPDGLRPEPGSLGGRLVDPVSGRIASWRTNPDTSGGPPTIDVREPDSTPAFTVNTQTPLGSEWGGDGGLYVLTADSLILPTRSSLVRIGPDGSAGPPILETGPESGVGLLGLRGGYAVVVIGGGRPLDDIQVVFVDVADPTRVSAVSIPSDLVPDLIGASLIPG